MQKRLVQSGARHNVMNEKKSSDSSEWIRHKFDPILEVIGYRTTIMVRDSRILSAFT